MNNHRKAYAHLKRAQEILEYGQVQHFGMEAGSSSKRPYEGETSKSKSSRVDYQPSRHLVLHARCDVSLGQVNPKTRLMEYKDRKDHEKNFTLTAPFVIDIDMYNNTIKIRTNSKNEGKCELSIDNEGTIKIRIETQKQSISTYTVDTPDAMQQIFLLTAEIIKLQLTQLQESDNFKFLQTVLDQWPEDLGQVRFLESVFDQLMEVSSNNREVGRLQVSTGNFIQALLRLHELMNQKD